MAIKSSYGDGGKTLTTTARANPNLTANANLFRALTQDRKSDYEERRLGRDDEVHERALVPPQQMSGSQQMRALSAPRAEWAPRQRYPTKAPRAPLPLPEQMVYLPYMPPSGSTGAFQNYGGGLTSDPVAVARGYLI